MRFFDEPGKGPIHLRSRGASALQLTWPGHFVVPAVEDVRGATVVTQLGSENCLGTLPV